MSERLPLFPLGTVLFPGLVLPLHIFEERYRLLVQRLLAQPDRETRRFGVVAIRSGTEAGDHTPVLHDVGCTALVRKVDALADGRFNVVAVGGSRFRLASVEVGEPYLVGEVEPLGEDVGAIGDRLVGRVRRAFTGYLAALLAVRGQGGEPLPELPAEPIVLSHLVAATTLLDQPDRQRLLEAPDAAARLAAVLPLLVRERAVLTLLHAVPAPELLQLPASTS